MTSHKFLSSLWVSNNSTYIVIVLAITALAAVFSAPTASVYFEDVGHDGRWYIAIAEGRIGEVVEPFSGRVLYPLIARWTDVYTPLDLSRSFFFVGMASLFFFLGLNFFILRKILPSPLLAIPLFLLPYFFMITRELLPPDVFYIFLTALFFFLLWRGKEWRGLIVLFLLFLTRETTIILGLVLFVVSFLRSEKLLFLGTIFVILVSLFTVSQFGELGIPNPHNLNGLLYPMAKLSFNFLNNIFGLELWVNTLAQNCDPIVKFTLPATSIFGRIEEVGVCGFDYRFPLITAITLLTTFGILPLIFFYILFRNYKEIFRDSPYWLLVALIAGLTYYFLGVVAGTGIERIVGYGWPVFLLATPFLMQKFLELDRASLIKLSLANLFVAWLPFMLHSFSGYFSNLALISIPVVVLIYYPTLGLLRKKGVTKLPA